MFSIFISSALLVNFLALEPDSSSKKLTLQEAFSKAIAKNERILQAKEDIPVAQGLAKQSLKGLLPTLEGGGKIGEQIGFSGHLKLPLFNVSSVLQTHSAFQAVQSVKSGYERKRDTLLIEVAKAYISVLAGQQLLTLSESQHQISQKQFESAKRKAELQEISKLDLKRAELLAAKTGLDIVNRRADLQGALGYLTDFLGENARFELEDFPEVLSYESMDFSKLLEQAKQDRTDLKSQQIALQAAWLSNQSAAWLFMPTFGFNTGVLLPLDKEHQWTWGFDLSVPLFDGYVRYGLLQSARAQLRQQKQKKHLLEREIALEIGGALVEINRRRDVYQIQKNLIEISQAAFKSAENRFQLGQATSLDLLDEQSRLFQAQKDYQEARFLLLQARLYLSYILGDPRKGLLDHG